MFNVVRMDLYRMLRAMSTKILVMFVLMFSVFCVTMTKEDINIIKEDMVEQGVVPEKPELSAGVAGEESMDFSIGVYSQSSPEWVNGKIKFPEFLESQLASGLFLVLCAIFVALFVHAEQKHGYVKNIAGQLPNKWMLVCSKLVAVAAQMALMFLVICVAMFVTGKIVFGEKMVLDSVLDTLKVVGIQYLLHMGFASVIIALCMVFRSAALSMTVGILIACKVPVMLYALGDKLLDKCFGLQDVNLSQYAIEMNVTTCSLSMDAKDWVRSIVVGVICIVIFILATCSEVQNRDVR